MEKVCGFAAWVTQAWLPFLPQLKIRMPSWVSPCTLWDRPESSESLETPWGASTQVKGLDQVTTQFVCEASGPLTTRGFYMRVP